MQFYMMTLVDVLGKIAWVRYDFLSQGKISDILIRCVRNILYIDTILIGSLNVSKAPSKFSNVKIRFGLLGTK